MRRVQITLTVALVLLFAAGVQAETILLDFESPAFTDYQLLTATDLAPYGITNITVGGSGPSASMPMVRNSSVHPTSSPTFILYQYHTANDGYYDTHTLTFEFDPPLFSFGLHRMGTLISANSTPAWTASFYNASDALLGSFGEPFRIGQFPPTPFSFTPSGDETITKMVLSSTWSGATFRNIFVDDFLMEFSGPVANETGSWGDVKSLYR
jgi:hypothetical protein